MLKTRDKQIPPSVKAWPTAAGAGFVVLPAPSGRNSWLGAGRLGSAGKQAGWHLWWVLLAAMPLVFLTLFFAWPVFTLVAKGFVTDGALDFSAFGELFGRERTWRLLGQTLGLAGAASVISVLLGLPGAFVLYRLRFPGRVLLRGLVSVPFVLPAVVVGVAFRSVLTPGGLLGGLGLDGTVTAIVAAMVFFNYPLVVRTVGNTWARLDSRPAEVAAALGARPRRVFLTVTLPRLAPVLWAVWAIVFLFCATSFALVLIMGGSRVGTIETEIYQLTTQFLDLRGAAVLSIVQLVVVAGCLYVAARMRRRSEATQVVRTDLPSVVPNWRKHWAPLTVTGLTMCGLLSLPIVGLVLRALHRNGQWTLANFLDLATTNNRGVLNVSALGAMYNSVQTALAAAMLSLLVGLAVSLVVSRRPRQAGAARAVTVLDGLFMLPLGVSAVTVGFGFLITLLRPPFNLQDSWWLVPLGQAVVAVPLIVRTITPTLRAIDPRQQQVAAALGASPWRVLWTVDGPFLLRSSLVAAGLAVAVSLGEFGATSFLARPDAPTLPVLIYKLLSRPGAMEQGLAMSASVLLAAAAAAVMVFTELFGERKAGRAW